MIGRHVGPDDNVLICLPLDYSPEPVVFGSVVIECDHCGRKMWRAPGRPRAYLGEGGDVKPAPVVMPDVTVWLCVECGLASWKHRDG
jgi:hypothetical protein